MASSVQHTNGDYAKTTTLPTWTGAWNFRGWVKCNSGEYGGAGETVPVGFGTTGGASEGFGCDIGFAGANTSMTVFVFRAGGSDIQSVAVLTGSDTAWVYVSVEYPGSGTTYKVRTRRENQTTFVTTNLTLTTAINPTGGEIRLGSDQFDEHALDSDTRHWTLSAATITDANLLTESQAINSAPAGTNLHWMRMLDAASAATNGGTGGSWTITGTLQTAASEPTESGGGVVDIVATRKRRQFSTEVTFFDEPARRDFWFPGSAAPPSALAGFIGLYQHGEDPPIETFEPQRRRLFPFVGSTSTIASASCASLGKGFVASFPAALQPATAASAGLGLAACSGAVVAPGFAQVLGSALDSSNGVTIAAGTPFSSGMALCGEGAVCFAPSRPTSLGLALVNMVPSAFEPGFASTFGFAQVSVLGAGINGTFVAGFGGGYGTGLAAASGFGLAAGRPASLGSGLGAMAGMLFAPSTPSALGSGLPSSLGASVAPATPTSVSVALVGDLGAGVTPATPASLGFAFVSDLGAAIGGSFAAGFAGGLGLGVFSGSGFGIAVGTPNSLGSGLVGKPAVTIAPGRPSSISLAFAFENGVAIVPGFAVASGSAIGYSLASIAVALPDWFGEQGKSTLQPIFFGTSTARKVP